ncbi:hypothetical protein [Cytobacillus luteolus]|uniref:hypothetical protein n=1 Tax=Litchfieldia luteola TaxID=682179 RepID=UPI0018771141|nr:hypothetical protein [Cytobacillus luteolus]
MIKSFVLFVLLVLGIELAILFGIFMFLNTNLLSTMFFGSVGFILVAFITGSKGDAISKGGQLAVFESLGGAYKPEHEQASLRVGPFLLGSILCFILYVILEVLL